MQNSKLAKLLSQGMESFLRSGVDMNVISAQIKDIARKECRLRVKDKDFDLLAQNEVADFIHSESKGKKLSGIAYLLYLGVSNEQAIYLLNKFEPENSK